MRARDGASIFAAVVALGVVLSARSVIGAGADERGELGPATRPTTAPAQQAAVARNANWPAYESIELGKRAGAPRANPITAATNDSGVVRVVGALGVVLGSIFVVRWVGRKFLGLPAGGTASGPVQVLSRMAIAPRQQLMLIQVGRRIVLVGNCGTTMNALCEISDADEVAALAGQLQQKKRTSATSAFLSIFGKAGAKFEAAQEAISSPEAQWDEAPVREPLVPELATTRQEMRGLLDRVHKLSKHYRRT